MSSSTPQSGIKKETWDAFRSALEDLLSEAAPGGGASSAAGELEDGDLKRLVTDAVGAVLLESSFLEKFLLRAFSKLSGEDRAKLAEQIYPEESVLQVCENAFRSLSVNHLAPMIEGQIKKSIAKSIAEFGKTEAFKSLIDSRFRVMEQYIRSDVVPKTLRSLLEKQV